MLKGLLKFVIKLTLAAGVLATPLYVENNHGKYLHSKVGDNVFILSDKNISIGGGTGFILNLEDGTQVLITNRHVCEGLSGRQKQLGRKVSIWAHQDDGTKYPVKIIKISRGADICALTAPEGFNGLNIGSEKEVAEKVYAIGHPALKPLIISEGRVIQRGLVEVGESEVRSPEECRKGAKAIFTGYSYVCVVKFDSVQTTMVILGGSSGSPVVDYFGNVVGIVFAGENGGLYWGSYVPLEYLEKFVLDLKPKK